MDRAKVLWWAGRLMFGTVIYMSDACLYAVVWKENIFCPFGNGWLHSQHLRLFFSGDHYIAYHDWGLNKAHILAVS